MSIGIVTIEPSEEIYQGGMVYDITKERTSSYIFTSTGRKIPKGQPALDTQRLFSSQQEKILGLKTFGGADYREFNFGKNTLGQYKMKTRSFRIIIDESVYTVKPSDQFFWFFDDYNADYTYDALEYDKNLIIKNSTNYNDIVSHRFITPGYYNIRLIIKSSLQTVHFVEKIFIRPAAGDLIKIVSESISLDRQKRIRFLSIDINSKIYYTTDGSDPTSLRDLGSFSPTETYHKDDRVNGNWRCILDNTIGFEPTLEPDKFGNIRWEKNNSILFNHTNPLNKLNITNLGPMTKLRVVAYTPTNGKLTFKNINEDQNEDPFIYIKDIKF